MKPVAWNMFVESNPDLAAEVRSVFAGHEHHVLATLRADGSPRVSGTNVEFVQGRVSIGMMLNSMKGADLARDPRCSLHSAPLDTTLVVPDIRIDAVAERIPHGLVPEWLRAVADAHQRPVPNDNDAEAWVLHPVRVSKVTVTTDRMIVTTWNSDGTTRIVSRV